MGMKLIDDDGTLLHEFPDHLGKYLLHRVLTVAKFTGEDQAEIILNSHVADLHRAIAKAVSDGATVTHHVDASDAHLRMLRDFGPRLARVLREQVLNGALPWPRWTLTEKRDFVRDVLYAPFQLPEQFLSDFIEEQDFYFARTKKALDLTD